MQQRMFSAASAERLLALVEAEMRTHVSLTWLSCRLLGTLDQRYAALYPLMMLIATLAS
jgi:hypothetical protein